MANITYELNDEMLYRISHEWFIFENSDPLKVEGVSLGLVLQVATYQFFAQPLLAGHSSGGMIGWLKRRQLLWPLRFWVGKLLALTSNPSEPTQVLAIYDINNRPLIDNLNALLENLMGERCQVIGVAVDPKIRCQAPGKLPFVMWTHCYGFADEINAWCVGSKIIDTFQSHRKKFLSNLERLGIADALQREEFLAYIQRELRQLVRETIAFKKLLLMYRPSLILLGSDAHRIGRIVVQLANTLQVHTAVVQHGATVGKYGYVPVMADCFLAWGNQTLEWLVERGVSAEKIIVVGNPRYDKLFVAQLRDSQYGPRLFLLPPPAGSIMTEAMLRSFFSAAQECNLLAHIKLHPSEKNISWFRDRIPTMLKNSTQIIVGPFEQAGLSIGDIVVLASSSAGIDAVIVGATIVNVNIEGLPNPIKYSDFSVGYETDLGNLTDVIHKALFRDIANYNEGRLAFISEYASFADGRALDRSVQVLKKLIAEPQSAVCRTRP